MLMRMVASTSSASWTPSTAKGPSTEADSQQWGTCYGDEDGGQDQQRQLDPLCEQTYFDV